MRARGEPELDVLIPTYRRFAALAVTLTSLCAQSLRGFRVIVSDQTEGQDAWEAPEVRAALRLLRAHGQTVRLRKHLPRRGLAEHRRYLLQRSTAPHVLFLDDDVLPTTVPAREVDAPLALLRPEDEETAWTSA